MSPDNPASLPTTAPNFKKRIHRWLREHIGEPVGPEGKHLPFPVIRRIIDEPCTECGEDATAHLEGWLADGSWVEVPLCNRHTGDAAGFLQQRKETLRSTDATKRQKGK